MKEIILVLLLLLLNLNISIAQENKVIRKEFQKYAYQEDKILPSSKVLYKYDENNNEILTQAFSWDHDSLKYNLYFLSSKNYSHSNKILTDIQHRLWNSSNQIDSITYEYDQFDSLSHSVHITTTTSSWGHSYYDKIEKFYSAGQLDSIYWYNTSTPNIWNITSKKYYTYSGNQTFTSKFFFSENAWIANGNTILTIDTIQNSQSFWTNFSDFAQEEMWVTYFDDKGNIIQRQYLIKLATTDSLELSSESFYSHVYDDIGLLIETNYVSHDYENGQIWFTDESKSKFDYYCDDLLKEKREYGDKLNKITNYYYQKGINCDLENEVSINIYPNPFHESIELEGDALEYQDVSVNIYNTIGQNVFSKSLIERTNKYSLELPALPKGIYLVTFRWNDYFITKKLVKN